jgi:hypothetical protein
VSDRREVRPKAREGGARIYCACPLRVDDNGPWPVGLRHAAQPLDFSHSALSEHDWAAWVHGEP